MFITYAGRTENYNLMPEELLLWYQNCFSNNKYPEDFFVCAGKQSGKNNSNKLENKSGKQSGQIGKQFFELENNRNNYKYFTYNLF